MLGSHFLILKQFKNDVMTMLRTSHVFEDVPGEMHMFCRAIFSGSPWCRSLSEDVPGENVMFNIRD
eukprot:6003813-Pyramimonas_sp.AAC.1